MRRRGPAAPRIARAGRAPWPRAAGVIALLATATAIAYSRVFSLGFVFDDRPFILRNARVLGGLSADNVLWAFTSIHHANWMPLTWVSCMLDVELFGPGPRGFHAVNLALHVANSGLLFLALRRLSGALWRPALVAALFALHPLNVETVAWVTERSALLATLFGLLALIAYRRHAASPGRGRLAAVALFLGLSLLAKPLFVTLPALLLLLDFWPLARAGVGPHAAGRPGAVLAEKLPLLALSAAAAAAALYAQRAGGAVSSFELVPLPLRLSNAALSYLRYLAKGLWPEGLAVYYPLETSLPTLPALAAAAALAALTGAALAAARRRPWLAVGWLWYLGSMIPMIGLVQVGGQALADRYAYVTFIGLFTAAAWGLAEAARHAERARRAVAAAAVAALGALGALTWAQTAHWRDEIALFEQAVRVTRANALAHNNLGVAYLARGESRRARAHLAAAARIAPGNAEVRGNLGNLLVKEGDAVAAVAEYRRALGIDPDLAEVRVNLGAALDRLRRPAEAEAEYREALRRRPGLAMGHMNLANLLSELGRHQEALGHYAEALRIDPGYADAYANRGVTHAQMGRPEEAAADYRAALRLAPHNAIARRGLGLR